MCVISPSTSNRRLLFGSVRTSSHRMRYWTSGSIVDPKRTNGRRTSERGGSGGRAGVHPVERRLELLEDRHLQAAVIGQHFKEAGAVEALALAPQNGDLVEDPQAQPAERLQQLIQLDAAELRAGDLADVDEDVAIGVAGDGRRE